MKYIPKIELRTVYFWKVRVYEPDTSNQIQFSTVQKLRIPFTLLNTLLRYMQTHAHVHTHARIHFRDESIFERACRVCAAMLRPARPRSMRRQNPHVSSPSPPPLSSHPPYTCSTRVSPSDRIIAEEGRLSPRALTGSHSVQNDCKNVHLSKALRRIILIEVHQDPSAPN